MHGAVAIVGWHGLSGHLDGGGGEVGLEALVVGREPQHAAGLQQRQALLDQRAVVAAHVEPVREGGRVADDERIPPLRFLLEKGARVGADQLVLRAVQLVQLQVVLRPAQVVLREIDRGGGRRPAGRRGAGEAAGVAEEVEHARALRFGPHPRARLAVVGEQAGVDVIVEVAEEAQPSLADLDAAAGLGQPLVARPFRGPGAALLEVHALHRHLERGRHRARHGAEPVLDRERLRARVLGHDQVALVPVDHYADLGDVAVVEPEGPDALLLEAPVQLPVRLADAVGEHLRLSRQVHDQPGSVVISGEARKGGAAKPAPAGRGARPPAWRTACPWSARGPARATAAACARGAGAPRRP